MKLLSVLLVLFAVLVAGCVGQSAQEQNIYATTSTPGGPTLEIISPQEGEVISGLSIIGIRVNVSGIKLLDPKPQNNPGEGHIDMTLDGRIHHTPFITDSFSDVAVGEHTLRVEIVNNDHTSLFPPVYKIIRFKRS